MSDSETGSDSLSADQWGTLLSDVEPATHGEVPRALEDRLGLSPDQARAMVDAALENGDLVEDDSGTFPVLTLAESGRNGDVSTADGGDGPEHSETVAPDDDATERAHEAFATAIEFFHDQLDRELPEVAGFDTPRDYFRESRRWNVETIEEKKLGYAPTDDTALLNRLMSEGYDRDAILGTGLFYENLDPHFRGRYVLPYFNEDGEPVYAISRSLAEHDDGHPNDPKGDQKYTKAIKTKDYSEVDEPIYGLDSLDEDTDRLLVAGGIADAITLYEAGYACISPVTTVQFKSKHQERVLDLVEEYGVERVYMINDAERPNINEAPRDDPERITDVLSVEQHGDGTHGAFANADFLLDAGVPTYFVELPLPAETDEFHKVDPDDYVKDGWGSLGSVIASANPATEHAGYAKWQANRQQRTLAKSSREFDAARAGGSKGANTSALYSLDFTDVSGLRKGYRGVSPLLHGSGSREDYYVVIEDHGELRGFNHKKDVSHNALTYLLCEVGERHPHNPHGHLSGKEHLKVWLHAKRSGLLPDDDPIPTKAQIYVAVDAGLCDRDKIEDGWKLPFDAYNQMLETVKEKYGVDPGRPKLNETHATDDGGGATSPRRYVETCVPPLTAHAEPLDVDARREEMLGEAYDRFVDTNELTIWAYNPGEGKTTNGAGGATERKRPHVVALPKHENCREFQLDEMKPDGYFHLKGAAQPVGAECMDAAIADRECKEHGHTSACPSMCPVYDLDKDEPIREAFDALAGTFGMRKAHVILGLYNESWHSESCEWLDQWDELESSKRVVTVHNYLTLKTVREHGDILIDDVGGSFVEDETVTLDQIARCRQALRRYAQNDLVEDRITDTFRLLDTFLDDVLDAITDDGDDRAELSEIDAPTFLTTTRTYDTREEIPDHISDAEIAETRTKEYVGEGGQYVYTEVYEVETNDLTEALAQARRHYNEVVVNNMREGTWNGTPLCLGTVFGALAAAFDDENDARAARVAAGVDVSLDSCPRCNSALEARDGARMCDECGWHEEYNRLTHDDTPAARLVVDVSTTAGVTEGLVFRRVPDVAALPEPSNVLILDATPRVPVYAAVFGADARTANVEAADAYSLPNATVTQFANGAYHRGTIEESAVARKSIQQTLEKISTIHDDVVYVSARKIRDLFDWPDASTEDVLYYYALRGLDAHREADAVMLVGAPHPAEDDLKAEGRLLSIDNPGVRAGGRELSTRDDPEAGEPIYRKLNYVDDDRNGRAVAAKTYSGISGDLFDSRHADEIVQAAHRVRPLLADESDEKHIYMLTNVPTQLPVDRLTTFDEFLDPLSGHVNVRDSALELLDAMVESSKDDENDAPYATDGGLIGVAGTASEWHDAAERLGMDVSQATISRALSDLRDAGLVKEGEYAHRRGRLQTLTQLGASVASISR